MLEMKILGSGNVVCDCDCDCDGGVDVEIADAGTVSREGFIGGGRDCADMLIVIWLE